MGQSQSHDQSATMEDIYSQYIQHQHDLLQQQQNQINQLYEMNLHQQQTPTNVVFQTGSSFPQTGSSFPQTGSSFPQTPDHSLPKLPSTKLDPYKILGLSKQFDETTLKKAYLKKALKAHRIEGGLKMSFKRYQLPIPFLKKLKDMTYICIMNSKIILDLI